MEAQIVENIAYFVLGLILLYAGAEFLVTGSSKMALLMRIRPMIIGLTVVAFGTSFPEFVTSLIAAWQNKIDVAIGNIVGSNIANLGLILGISAMITPVLIQPKTVRSELYWMLAGSIIFWLFTLNRLIGHVEGIALLLGILVFTVVLIRQGANERKNSLDDPHLREELKWIRNFSKPLRFLIYAISSIIGILLLMAGSDQLIDSATEIARILGVSELIIGLSLVAFGTSLPELATAVISMIRKESEILVGNVVGSNIFNLLFVGGSLSVFFRAPIQERVLSVDLPLMLLISIVLVPVALKVKKISRLMGSGFFLFYLFYIIFVFIG